MIRKVIIMVLTLGAVGTALLWLASTVTGAVRLSVLTERRAVIATFDDGLLHIGLFHADPATGSDRRDLTWSIDVHMTRTDLTRRLRVGTFRSFYVVTYPRHMSVNRIMIGRAGVPCWVPLTLFATYPTIAFFRGPVRRWRRRRTGLCLTCGYDLTGNVSGVCPECGTAAR